MNKTIEAKDSSFYYEFTMFTIFDLFQFIFIIAGLIIGASLGFRNFGYTGCFIGLIIGTLIGYICGRIPFLIAWRSLNIRSKTTDELRAMVRRGPYPIHHLVLTELYNRKEDIRHEFSIVLQMLISENHDERIYGYRILRNLYPSFAEKILDYNPDESSNICKLKVENMSHRI